MYTHIYVRMDALTSPKSLTNIPAYTEWAFSTFTISYFPFQQYHLIYYFLKWQNCPSAVIRCLRSIALFCPHPVSQDNVTVIKILTGNKSTMFKSYVQYPQYKG